MTTILLKQVFPVSLSANPVEDKKTLLENFMGNDILSSYRRSMCTIEKAVALDMTQNTVLTASHGSFTGLRMKI